MSELKSKPGRFEGYPYHLPAKPLPVGPDGKVSYEAFFDWLDEDTLAEWVDGEVVMASPSSRKHQDIAGLLYEVFKTFANIYDLGIVLQNPFQMKLPGKKGSGREPDLIFLAKANLNRLETGLIRGAGDLVIEVVSPESVERDREDKFKEYAEGGVPEYWLIDTTDDTAEFYRLEQGKYKEVKPDEQGRYYSRELRGFWLKPEWLWRSPLPSAPKILKAVARADYESYLQQQTPEEGF